MSPVISVRGEALLEVEPEIAHLIVHVQARDGDRKKTLDRLTERNNRCLDLIRSYGVERVETSGISVYPEATGRGERVKRYLGTVRTAVTVADFTVLGELITRLADQDLAHVDGPFWALKLDSPVFRRARHQAVQEAVRRAKEYAEALGSRVTGMLELSDEGLERDSGHGRASGMMRMNAFGGAPEAAPPLDLEPERQTVRAGVVARFTASDPDEL